MIVPILPDIPLLVAGLVLVAPNHRVVRAVRERNEGVGSGVGRASSSHATAACSASVGSTGSPARAATADRKRAFGASTPQ
jgi:hypothetical protein